VQPRFIRSTSEFGQIVEFGKTTESLCLEFKSTVDGWLIPKGAKERDRLKREGQKELCRDISQFANAIGGCVLLGIQETSMPGSQLTLATGVEPIKDPQGLKHWVEQAIKNYLVPSTFRRDIHEIEIPDGHILAINVLPSRSLVAVWDDQKHTQEFVYRTSYGKEYMNPDDVERQRDGNSRAGKISFEMAMGGATVKDEVEVANGYWKTEDTGYKGVRVLGTKMSAATDQWVALDVLQTNVYGPPKTTSFIVPYSLIREAWVAASGRVTILLSARPVLGGRQFDDTSVTLEPY
jgi:hypothetical protein